jgi:nucleoside-triphosphatase
MNVLLTGAPGVGKSTCIIKIVRALCKLESNPSSKICGFYTSERRIGRARVDFDGVCVSTGAQCVLASTNGPSTGQRSPKVGRYKVHINEFEKFALDRLQLQHDVTIIVCDEIGKMELFSQPFLDQVRTSKMDYVLLPIECVRKTCWNSR